MVVEGTRASRRCHGSAAGNQIAMFVEGKRASPFIGFVREGAWREALEEAETEPNTGNKTQGVSKGPREAGRGHGRLTEFSSQDSQP